MDPYTLAKIFVQGRSPLEYNGMFYLYVSTTPANITDMHQQSLKVAVADSPVGPFRFAQELLPPFSIDAHAVVYKKQLYLFYSVNDESAARPGTYIVVDRMLSPYQTEGRPVAVVRPTLDEEIFCRDRFQKGVHWHTVEGAFYFRHGDCDDLRELEWHKYPDENTYQPLLASTREVDGPGHNSILEKDGQLWIFYHGRDRDVHSPQEDCRCMRADRLMVNGDRLWVDVRDALA